MALIQCGECGRQISDKATACPGCGAPIEHPSAPPRPVRPVTWRERIHPIHVATAVILLVAGLYLFKGSPRVDDPLDFSTPPQSRAADFPQNAEIRDLAIQQFRGMDPIMVGTWPRRDEFLIAAVDRSVDWQQRADGACAWIRAQGMRGRFSVQVVEMAALNNKRIKQLAYAACN